MSDPGTRYADARLAEVEKRLKGIYNAAALEIVQKMNEGTQRFRATDAKWRALVQTGEKTQAEYQDWLRRQMTREKVWKDKLDSAAHILLEANERSARIVNGERWGVFGENATYQAYQLEHDAGMDLSFTVYDRATVTRIIREQPELMPPRKINGDRDVAWNKEKMSAIMARSIIAGLSIPEIAKRIASETALANEKAAVRYARTAMTAAQNAGRMETMREATLMGIKVKKMWLATLDERTRESHQELDGQVQDVEEPFDSILGPIMYPGDPGADDANVWNCRCTLTYKYEEYPEKNAMRYDQVDGIPIEDITYKEWKAAKPPAPSVQPVQPAPEAEKQPESEKPADAVEGIKETIANHTGDWTIDDLQAVGKAVADEIEKLVNTDELVRERDALSAKLAELRAETQRLQDEKKKLYADMSSVNTKEERDAWYAEVRKLNDQINALFAERSKIVDRLDELKNGARSNALGAILGEVRTVGGVTAQNVSEYADFTLFPRNAAKCKENLMNAMNVYPSAWLEKSKAANLSLFTRWTTTRAYYMPTGEIRISDRLRSNIHELAHRFEWSVPGLKEAEKAFYEKRTAGEPLKWLGSGYRRDEKSRFDNFADPYCGKEYGGDFYELLSMGFQWVFTSYDTLDADTDMRDWTIGVLFCK